MQSKIVEGETIMVSDSIASSIDFSQFENEDIKNDDTKTSVEITAADYVVIETESGVFRAALVGYSEFFKKETKILTVQAGIFDRRDLKKIFELPVVGFSIWCGNCKVSESNCKNMKLKKRELTVDSSSTYIVELIFHQ